MSYGMVISTIPMYRSGRILVLDFETGRCRHLKQMSSNFIKAPASLDMGQLCLWDWHTNPVVDEEMAFSLQ